MRIKDLINSIPANKYPPALQALKNKRSFPTDTVEEYLENISLAEIKFGIEKLL